MRKKHIGISLLLVMVAPALVTYCWLQYKKAVVWEQVKLQMIEGIDEDELVLLKLSKKEQQRLWWEHPQEFEYRNQMYDVVKSEKRGDTTYYWCWWDNEETKLNRQLEELVSQAFGEDPRKHEKQERLFSYFRMVYFPGHFNWKTIAQEIIPGKFMNFYRGFTSLSFPPPTPPPQVS